MRRADFLNLTGLTVDFFLNLSRRNQLPFSPGRKAEGKGWSAWSSEEALMTVVSLELSEAMERGRAAQLVWAEREALRSVIARAIRGEQVDFGAAIVTTGEWDAEHNRCERSSLTAVVCGTWAEIQEQRAGIVKAMPARSDVSPPSCVLSIISINQCLALLLDRARAHGLKAVMIDLAEGAPSHEGA